MRGECGTRELLPQLLLGGDLGARDCVSVLAERQAWDEAVQCADAWNVTPRLVSQISRLKLDVPQAPSSELRRHFAEAYRSSAFLASRGIAAIRHLEAGGVRVAAFQGLASIARLGDGPKGRTMDVVDLLISEKDLERAVWRLEENGFRRQVFAGLRQHAALSERKAIALTGSGESRIDLHWGVGKGLGVAEILERAEVARLWDQKFPVVSPEDALLLSARHAACEDLQIESVCQDLIDIQFWLAHLTREGRLDSLAGRAAGAGMTPLVLAITQIIEGYDSASEILASLSPAASARELRESASLVELYRVQLHDGPLGRDRPGPCQSSAKRPSALARVLRKLRPGRLRAIRALARIKYG